MFNAQGYNPVVVGNEQNLYLNTEEMENSQQLEQLSEKR